MIVVLHCFAGLNISYNISIYILKQRGSLKGFPTSSHQTLCLGVQALDGHHAARSESHQHGAADEMLFSPNQREEGGKGV